MKIIVFIIKAVWFVVRLPIRIITFILFGGSLRKKISNPNKWEESKKGNSYYKIRDNFVVICFPYNDDEEERKEGEYDHYKLMIKKDDDDYYVRNKFDCEEDAIENAYSALKQLKLL